MTTINKVFAGAMTVIFSVSMGWSGASVVNSKLSDDLRQSLSITHDHRVIVSYAPGLAESGVQALVARAGRTAHRFSGVAAFAASLSRRDIEALAADGRVMHISPDRKIAATMDIAVPTIGADKLNKYLGYSGRGVTVAVIDSGITPCNAVSASRILASVDFTG